MVRATIPTLRKHIPGEPTIAYQYMPGGGSTQAANHIFHNTKPDGLTIGRIGGGLVANAALKEAGVPPRSRQTDLSGLRPPDLSLGFYHPARCRLRQLGSATPGQWNTHRRPGGRPFQLFRRPPVCLADRPQRAENAGWLPEISSVVSLRRNRRPRKQSRYLVRRNAEMLAKGMIDIHAIMEVPRGLKQSGFDRLPEIDEFAKTARERRLT